MNKVSIVTPWRDCLHFLPDYLDAVKGADEVIIVDGGCNEESLRALKAVFPNVVKVSGPWSFGAACNAGLKASTGDIVVMLNNDVKATGDWISQVRAHVRAHGIYGRQLMQQNLTEAGIVVPFLSGWCIAARRTVWDALDGFDTVNYTGGYWEDNDLCWRAMQEGFGIIRTEWPIIHLENGTSRHVPTALDSVSFNKRVFIEKVCREVAQC